MNVFLEKIKKYLGRFENKTPSYERKGIKPERDWGVILILGLIFLCLSGILARYIFVQIEKGNLFSSEVEKTDEKIIINQKLLEETVNRMDTKQINLDNVKKNRIAVPDPSI